MCIKNGTSFWGRNTSLKQSDGLAFEIPASLHDRQARRLSKNVPVFLNAGKCPACPFGSFRAVFAITGLFAREP